MNASDSEKEDAEIEATETAPDEENAKLKKKEKKKKKKASSKDAEKKRGVCYMSRIPPHMDHVKLRHILSQFGDIQRIFLAPQGLSLSRIFGLHFYVDTNLKTFLFLIKF